MIISRTPFRMSFFGGGTDYPIWFREHGGSILATTFDKYCYITCRYLPPFFEHSSRILYSKVETVFSNDEIEHPSARGTLKYMGIEDGVEIHHDGDLPARTGVGSSSSFTVGLLHSLCALKGIMPTKMQLAKEAIYIEQEMLQENVGCQDQVLAAFGGLLKVDFFSQCDIALTPIIMSQQRLAEFQDHLLLYFTGFSRTASEIAKEQIENTRMRRKELELMRQMVDQGVSILTGGSDLKEFGDLLHESWLLKRSLSSKISNPLIDEIYDVARRAGAIGGKIMGAGGGGFMLLFARPAEQPRIKETLRGLLLVPFHFENQGSQIILYQPQPLIKRDYPPELSQKMRWNDVSSCLPSPGTSPTNKN